MLKYVPLGRLIDRINKVFDDFKWKVSRERRLFHEQTDYTYLQNNSDNKMNEGDTKKVKKALGVLDLLLLAEKEGQIDEIGVCEEFLTMITAGFETTGMTICYLLTLLAENKEAQNLARTEVREVLGDYTGPLTMEHLKKMDYLGRCVKESLRILPTVPLFARLISDEVELSNYRIPPGSEVVVSVFDVHRDPQFWPEPEKFDPDRFLSDNLKNQHPFAYIPFSGGMRSCIGQKFALLEVKTVTAQILRDFYLEPIDASKDFKFLMSITLKVDDLHLKFIKINS
ncbi:probable cytochrome P450 4p2 [Phymastichus coffea]|uniref:probable cytochrome P450 4p2 n=1 Tax=Phymastichus coffea TaxID=108790 RepID=UPI00273BE828|nr:probable cytochrome P450 4p2 [Phymastichus coffea]